MHKTNRIAAVCLLALPSLHVHAAGFSERFEPLNANSFIAQSTQGDEAALEVSYSFKYSLYRCDFWDAEEDLLGCSDKPFFGKASAYLKYNGEFDFYAGSRASGPVINRLSNPGFHLQFDLTDKTWIDEIDFGVEHRSNGQVTSANEVDQNPASPTFGRTITDIEFERGNHKYFDTISRGADYLSLTARGETREATTGYSFSAKYYFGDEESNITWGEQAGSDLTFKDYDLWQLGLWREFSFAPVLKLNKIRVGAEYTLGEGGLATDSIDVTAVLPFKPEIGWELPVLIKAHFGPMDRLSDYTRSRRSFGVGLAFSY